MNPYFTLSLALALGVAGQITLKHGAMTHVQTSIIALFLNRVIIGGLFFYVLSASLYIYSLRNIPVSVAFSSVSISYFFVTLIAHYLWGEPFGYQQIIALILIGSGVFLMFR